MLKLFIFVERLLFGNIDAVKVVFWSLCLQLHVFAWNCLNIGYGIPYMPTYRDISQYYMDSIKLSTIWTNLSHEHILNQIFY